jgi:hypothetical protein
METAPKDYDVDWETDFNRDKLAGGLDLQRSDTAERV